MTARSNVCSVVSNFFSASQLNVMSVVCGLLTIKHIVETPLNSQNNRLYAQATRKRAVSPVKLIRDRQRFSQKVLVLPACHELGRLALSSSSRDPRLTVSIIVSMFSVPEIRARCQRYYWSTWTLQQDGAPSHTDVPAA